eukprot:m.221170 g.221170  ORF g.221170 m.221170 type:complete len:72 (+) comp15608_c0_seq5:1884-2099(+)
MWREQKSPPFPSRAPRGYGVNGTEGNSLSLRQGYADPALLNPDPIDAHVIKWSSGAVRALFPAQDVNKTNV